MKHFFRIIFCLCPLACFSEQAMAKHIKGGYIQYEYQGAGTSANTSVYKITVIVYRSCTENGPMPGSLGIYDAVTNAVAMTISNTSGSYLLSATITKTTFDACLNNPPSICYQLYKYTTTVTLADNANGYLIAAQDANRSADIINIVSSAGTGITFLASIPGTINGTDYHVNSSPNFIFKDTAIICYNSSFQYQFEATDADADSLSYSFGDGLNGTSALSAPPYTSLTYNSGYSGTAPLGTSVSIDPFSGLISGVAPATIGEYVLAVYVKEWRNGVMINSTKKELQINVTNCSITNASLKASYINCNNFSFSFQNESTSSNIVAYHWDFGVTTVLSDTSNLPTPTYNYPDTGSFVLKLVVTSTGGCKDSTTSIVKVYPGFRLGFTVQGSCYQTPFVFTDTSYIKYGTVDYRLWDFGDNTVSTDTSSLATYGYVYPAAGNYTASLHLTSTKGCDTTITQIVTVKDKPYLHLPFTDTLICSVDTLPLIAQVNSGTSVFWTPNYNISNQYIATPYVFPHDTTTYQVVAQESGCKDSATIKVNVLQFITVELGNDLALCKTDSVLLQPVSYALSYVWTPTTALSNAHTKYPKAAPATTTQYFLTSNLGKCQAKDSITIFVAPYPQSNAGKDTAICIGGKAQLHGSINATYFSWKPITNMLYANTLDPVVAPSKTTTYILTVTDTSYCKKAVNDSVDVNVIVPWPINLGNDTTVVVNQPLQLNAATAGNNYTYTWQPATYLSSTAIQDPIALFPASAPDYMTYYVTAITPDGCVVNDNLTVKVFKTAPDILVPSGFTPNGDGKNDILKPILLGIAKLNYFNIYNRYGQMIYSTSEPGKGWDGTIGGVPQTAGDTFVFMAQGIDYFGNVIFRKGTTVLIR